MTFGESLTYSGVEGGWQMPGDQTAFERIRAEERTRIAQLLHDFALQRLAVLQLTLGRMRREGVEGLDANIAECEAMVAQIGRELRQIDEAGL